MAKLPTKVKYKGTTYLLRGAGDISVSPGANVGPEGELLLERKYPTESRGLYRDNNGEFFAKIKLDWQTSDTFDELTFDLTPESAWMFFLDLVKEPKGKLDVHVSKEEVKQLQGLALKGKKPPAEVDPSKVIDISGHYVRVSYVPADLQRVDAAHTHEGLLREELSQLSRIEGRFCVAPFNVMGLRYDVPENVVQLFAESLTDALQEHLQKHANVQVPIDISITDSCGPVDAHGGIYAFGNNREELNNLRAHLEGEVLFPVWREIWHSFQKGLIPAEEKQRALASFKVKVLAAIRSEGE